MVVRGIEYQVGDLVVGHDYGSLHLANLVTIPSTLMRALIPRKIEKLLVVSPSMLSLL